MESLRFSEYCANCRKSLAELEKLLFVEKEVGRCFCSEECIQDYFQPMVDFMREELKKNRQPSDLCESDFARYSHYRGLTLEDPDEIWVDETENGERLFTFISNFRNGDERLSFVVVCLAIEAIPSFIFLAFPTLDEMLVNEYRRGADMRINQEPDNGPPQIDESLTPAVEAQAEQEAVDAANSGSMTAMEKLYTELRQPNDIARSDFEKFETYIEPTLEDPDELWKLVDDDGNSWCTFISRHSSDDQPEEFAMIVVCEQSLDEETGARTLEIVFTFPTIDAGLMQHFRKGIAAFSHRLGSRSVGVRRTRSRAA